MSGESNFEVSDRVVYAGRVKDGEKVVYVDILPEDMDSHPTYQHGIMNGVKGLSSAHQIEPRGDLNYDAQDKFEWGYRGGGPATTSASVLSHLLGDGAAEEHMIDFMKNFLAGAGDEWHIKASEIPQYLEE